MRGWKSSKNNLFYLENVIVINKTGGLPMPHLHCTERRTAPLRV